jgi:hypothetical protein
MFRVSLCPSSRAYQLQQQLLVYLRKVVVAVLLAVVGPKAAVGFSINQTTGPTTANSNAINTFVG